MNVLILWTSNRPFIFLLSQVQDSMALLLPNLKLKEISSLHELVQSKSHVSGQSHFTSPYLQYLSLRIDFFASHAQSSSPILYVRNVPVELSLQL